MGVQPQMPPQMMQGFPQNQGYRQKPMGQMPQANAMPIPGLGPMNLLGGPKPKREYDNSISLYVGNLTPTTFDNDLFKFFTSKGYKLKNAKVMHDHNTKRSKQFGYLNFYSKEEAERCLKELNNAVLDGKQLVLNKKKDSDFDSQANVLIKNLPKELKQNELYTIFGKYG